MNVGKWLPVLPPFTVAVLGSNLQWTVAGLSDTWGEVLASVYFIPIVIAAVSLGERQALLVAAAAGGSQAIAWLFGRWDSAFEPIAHTTLFVCVAVATAKLTEWRRRSATELGPAQPTDLLAQSSDSFQDPTQLPAVSPLISGLIRQFRTPVASIEGAGWVLEDSLLPDEKRRELVSIIRKESHRLNRVLSEVLDFTRPRKPRPQKVELARLIDEVIQLAGPKEHGPLFLFSTDIPSDFPPLRCDPEQMQQALLSVALNAIQASPGGGQIEISARIEQDNAVIRVRDHGHGIHPEARDKVFDPFFTTHENSLGLGLPVASRILREHGGRMAIEATSERGTCLSLVFPASPM